MKSASRTLITAMRSAYYMIKVLLALFIGIFRRYSTQTEES